MALRESAVNQRVPSGGIIRRTEVVGPAMAAILLGALILYGAGFAQPRLLHDAAHDVRHAFALPCH